MNQPEPQSLSYNTLLADIDRGLVKIPQFQREFVWTREKSAALIDSILRGYPIGTFILWRTRETLRTVRNIGNVTLPATPEGEYANQVLDGQQRLTSLYASIRGLGVTRADGSIDDFSEIRVDLAAGDDEAIVVVGTEGRPEGSTIRIVDLVEKSFTFFGKFDERFHTRLEACQSQLKSYQFATILVRDAPIDVATEIFTRINEGGKPLTPFEIMVAKTYVDGEFDLAERSDALAEELGGVEYETVPPNVFLQVASILLTGDCRKRTVLSLKKRAFVDAWPRVETAIRRLSITFAPPTTSPRAGCCPTRR